MNDERLESILRAAPQPPAPAGLPERLTPQFRRASATSHPAPPLREGGWLQRWWPTLLLGGGIVACAATLLTQQGTLRDLDAHLKAIHVSPDPQATHLSADLAAGSAPSGTQEDDRRLEILRLRDELRDLQAESAAAVTLAADNRQLEDQLAAGFGLSPEDLTSLDQAREKARSIRCVNHMKNLGLALRIWATDHHDLFPTDLLVITNELGSTKMLVCPSDSARLATADWTSFSPGQISYEFLAPGGTDADPQRVASRCPIHRHVLLSDGSVQMSQGEGTNLTQHLVTRDGKLYFE